MSAKPVFEKAKKILKKLSAPLALLLEFLGKTNADGVGSYAAQSAFFILMTVFPFMILLLQLMRFAPISQESLLLAVDSIFPDYLLTTIHGILQEIYTSTFGLVPLTIITALWASSKTVHSLTSGLNRIYKGQIVENWFIVRLWALLYTFLVALLLIIVASSTVFWQTVRSVLIHFRPKGVPLYLFSSTLRGIYVVLLLGFSFAVMYKFLPHRKMKFIYQLPGAFAASIAWYIFSILITIYITDFNGFSMYGSLATLTLIMFWLFFSCYIIFLGAEINEFLHPTPKEEQENRQNDFLFLSPKRVQEKSESGSDEIPDSSRNAVQKDSESVSDENSHSSQNKAQEDSESRPDEMPAKKGKDTVEKNNT